MPMGRSAQQICQGAKRCVAHHHVSAAGGSGLVDRLAFEASARLESAKVNLGPLAKTQDSSFGLPGCLSKTPPKANGGATQEGAGLHETVAEAAQKQLDSAKAKLEKSLGDAADSAAPWRQKKFGLPSCHSKATPKGSSSEQDVGLHEAVALAATKQLESAKNREGPRGAPWRRRFGLQGVQGLGSSGCLVKTIPKAPGAASPDSSLHESMSMKASEALESAKANPSPRERLPPNPSAPWRRSFGLRGVAGLGEAGCLQSGQKS